MDAVAIWSITASAVVGSLGIIVPAFTRKQDREHETELERERAELAHEQWIRVKRGNAYERVLTALEKHEKLDDNPQLSATERWGHEVDEWCKQERHDADAVGPAREPPVLSVDDLISWQEARRQVLLAVRPDVAMWGSANLQRVLRDLESAATLYDGYRLMAASNTDRELRQYKEVVSHSPDLITARLEVMRQIAFDLQGLELYFSTPSVRAPGRPETDDEGSTSLAT
jgi:hypothetical protein